MMHSVVDERAPIPPPYYRAQARLGEALHIVAPLCLVTSLHLLTLSSGRASGASSLPSSFIGWFRRLASDLQ